MLNFAHLILFTNHCINKVDDFIDWNVCLFTVHTRDTSGNRAQLTEESKIEHGAMSERAQKRGGEGSH